MEKNPKILCIGSVLWDVIGRSSIAMQVGSDVPGHITRLPGGVAMNIAMTLRNFGLRPALLSVIGQDRAGKDLIKLAKDFDLDISYLYRSHDLPTDQYMAIEGSNGVIAAIADAHSLEAAGNKILEPLSNGQLGTSTNPFSGVIALDGNLTTELLTEISSSVLFASSDLRVAPASPGKAERLIPLLTHKGATFYANVKEAELLCQKEFLSAEAASRGLVDRGAHRAVVTDGPKAAALADQNGFVTAMPPYALATKLTGTGDTFMAAHIAAELNGTTREISLQSAANAASNYVSGKSGNK